MTKVYIVDHNSVLSEIRKHVTETSFSEADVVFLWTDTTSQNRQLIELARKQGKKVYCFQHGRKGSSKYYPPFNEPIVADKLLVWGEFDRNRLIAAGHPKGKIEVIGTTILQNLPKKCEPSGTQTIVFCPEHWDRPIEENIRIRDELRKLKGYNIVTKLIESHDPALYDNVIQTHRDTPEHLEKCKEVLSSCRLVIGVSESTFELMAQAMDIPVIIVTDWEPKAFGGDMSYTQYPRLVSSGSYKVSLDQLLTTIYAVIKEDTLTEERKKAAIEEGGIGIDTLRELKRLKLS